MYVDALIDGAISLANTGIQSLYANKVTKQTFAREDSAVQRRVADLKAAGLSPVLAAGSAAASSSPVSVGAPQIDFSAMDRARLAADMARMKADITRTEAETSAINARAVPDKMIARVWQTAEQMVKDPDSEQPRSLEKFMAFNLWDRLEAETKAFKANAETAAIGAAQRSRELQYDVAHNIYSPEARANQALSTWLNSAGLKDMSGPAVQTAGELLKMILNKRIPGRIPQK